MPETTSNSANRRRKGLEAMVILSSPLEPYQRLSALMLIRRGGAGDGGDPDASLLGGVWRSARANEILARAQAVWDPCWVGTLMRVVLSSGKIGK